MTTITLKNKKQISITTINGKASFSLLIEIPIHNEAVRKELANRQDYFLQKWSGKKPKKVSQSFHIELMKLTLNLEQIEPFLEKYQAVMANIHENIDIFTTQNVWLEKKGQHFPAVLMFSPQIDKIYKQFETNFSEFIQSIPKGFQPYISLFDEPFPFKKEDSFTDCPDSVVSSDAPIHVIHKNEKQVYHELDINDLREIADFIHKPSITAFTFMQFMQNKHVKRIAGLLLLGGIAAIIFGTSGVAIAGVGLAKAGWVASGIAAALLVGGLFGNSKRDLPDEVDCNYKLIPLQI